MNNARRKAIEAIHETLTELRDQLEQLRDEEQEYADNMPENMQCGEKHEAAEAAVYNLDDAIGSIESAADTLEELVNA
ncbi:MAG: hypothetical protein IJV65_07520 [Kiritimatiellae bacterium]|nr:hypothetical protein [Kiritimatiellia bacterium]